MVNRRHAMIRVSLEDMIHAKSWMDLGDCNYEIDHDDDDSIPESGVVYCNIEHIHKFFAKCERTTNKYVVISGFSDYGVAYQEEYPVAMDMIKTLSQQAVIGQLIPNLGYGDLSIPSRCDIEKCNIRHKYSVRCYGYTFSTFAKIPDNVVKWFTVNPLIEEDKIQGIPLGVGKDAARDIFETKTYDVDDKINIAYVNWQDHTLERSQVKQAFIDFDPHWATIVLEPKDYRDYLDELSKHIMGVCPAGNGTDCYRTLESIYLGCIPIVKRSPTINYLDGLPLLIVDNWNEISQASLKEKYSEIITSSEYSLDKSKLSYWKKQIEETRKLL